METTGHEIFKKLSGQVSNIGGVISGVKHGIEDMKKSADQAAANKNIDVARQAEANKVSTEKVEAIRTQNENFSQRAEEIKAKATVENNTLGNELGGSK